jgi:hypothetical protein
MTSSLNRRAGRGVLVFKRPRLEGLEEYGGWVYIQYGYTVGLPTTVGPFDTERDANMAAAQWLMERRQIHTTEDVAAEFDERARLPRKTRKARK